ncbi:MAG: TolC family protein [Silvibacterium sp.]|nr:TolC family protein [Silvibacterium sp.]
MTTRPLQYGNAALLAVFLIVTVTCRVWAQNVPVAPNAPWHSSQERRIEQDARKILSKEFTVDSAKTYSLGELIDLAEAHNPETRLAWEQALSHADVFGVARSELYPTVAALAISNTLRQQTYLGTRYYRQTLQSFDLALDLNYTIFDFGARSGRINAAKAELLASDFGFNDVHRRLIYRVETAYYQLLNAIGQEAAARASLANAQTVQQSAEESLKNGLATLPDVLEARSATAQAIYILQAAIGAEDTARGDLATSLGASPLFPMPVQPIEKLSIPDSVEDSVDQAIARALEQRPDLLQRVAEIRSANARGKEARAAYYPSLRTHVYPDPQYQYGMQQQLPWGQTGGLNGQITFSLEWTVFDGGARKHRLAEALHDAHAAEAEAAVTRDQIENGIWTAYSNLKTALRQREAAAALLQAADQSYNAALESYRYGVRNLVDVTVAQRTLAQARSDDVFARTQVLSSLAALAFQTGDSVQPHPARPQP